MPGVPATLRALYDVALDWLAPPFCPACDEPVAKTGFCQDCAKLLRPAPSGMLFDGVPLTAAAIYREPVAPAIRRFKYAGRSDLALPVARLLLPALGSLRAAGVDWVVPVPLHPRRLTERGYNQAALVARLVARELGATCAARALVRRYDTPHQASLPRAQRLKNVAHAFRVRRPDAVVGRRVVLVDDVVTTGATVTACVRALVQAGAELSGILAIACTTNADEDAA